MKFITEKKDAGNAAALQEEAQEQELQLEKEMNQLERREYELEMQDQLSEGTGAVGRPVL